MYPIPANATRIRYLESTGTQYIDTGVVSQANLVYDFYLTETTNNIQRRFFGFIESIPPKWLGTGMNSANWGNGWFYVNFAKTETNLNIKYPNRNGLHHFDYTDGNASFSLNGNKLWTSTRTGTYSENRHVFVFAQDYNNSSVARGIGRISYFKVTKNGNLLFDGIPVRVGQVGYLFDRVSGQLFGNAGTGDFVLGPDTFSQGVVPTRMMVAGVRKRPYDAEVEYIESTGAQYVDTGIRALDYGNGRHGIRVDAVVSWTQIPSQYQCLCGSFGSGTTDGMNGERLCLIQTGYITPSKWGYSTNKNMANSDMSIVAGQKCGVTSVLSSYYCYLAIRPENEQQTILLNETGTWHWADAVNITLFARNTPLGPGYFATGRIYSMRMSNQALASQGIYVRDFIPVRVGTVGYLFDRANPTGGPLGNGLYGSATSTPLVAGPDRIPS